MLDPASLAAALSGVETAYYLVHSMGGVGSFEDKDREAAQNFANAAKAAGLKRIIYLGGLGDDSDELSEHLRSRQEVGGTLRDSGVPTKAPSTGLSGWSRRRGSAASLVVTGPRPGPRRGR